MKNTDFLLSLLAVTLGSFPALLHGQASAVDGMTALNQTATVNTAFIATTPYPPSYLNQTVPTRSTGTFQRVYSCSGDVNGVTGSVGTAPEESLFWPGCEYFYATGKWYKLTAFEDGYFYIERYTETYNSSTGALTWTKVIYRGPATIAPVLNAFTVSSPRIWQGQSVTTAATATDADNDLWALFVEFQNPATSSTTSVGASGWCFDSPSLTINNTRVPSTVGKWRVSVYAEDWASKTPVATSEGASIGMTDVKWVEVLPGAYYDPAGTAYAGGTVPTLSAPSGNSLVLTAGQGVLSPVKFKVAGVGAGKPVRVSVGWGGGLLFGNSGGTGTGATFLELTTDASGEVTVWLKASDKAGATSAVYAVAGRGRAEVAVRTRLSADSENPVDGMSDVMEAALNGTTSSVNFATAPAVATFKVF